MLSAHFLKKVSPRLSIKISTLTTLLKFAATTDAIGSLRLWKNFSTARKNIVWIILSQEKLTNKKNFFICRARQFFFEKNFTNLNTFQLQKKKSSRSKAIDFPDKKL